MEATARYIISLMFVVFVGFPKEVFAKNAESMLQEVSLAEGLSGLSATDFCMDSDEQMWISTSQGLSVYNGQFVTSFTVPGVSSRNAYSVHLDINVHGDVYLAGGGGLFVLPFGESQLHQLVNHPVLHVRVANDLVYYGDTEGLHVLNSKGHSRLLFKCSLEDLSVRCIRIEKDKVWFTVSRKLGYYDLKSKKVVLKYIISSSSLTDFSLYGDNVFIGTKSDGLLCYNRKSQQMKCVPDVMARGINSVKVSGSDICIGTEGFGAYLLDGNTGVVKERFSTFGTGAHQLPSNTLKSYFRDRTGTNWFGIYYHGAIHSFYTNPVFTLFSNATFSTKGMNVRCFLQDGDNLLLGTHSGLYFFKGKNAVPKFFSPEKYGANIITSIAKFGDKYYVATYDFGLYVLDPLTGSFTHAEGNRFFENSTFYCVKNAPDGTLWVTGCEGVFVIKPTGEVKLILVQDEKIRRMPMYGIVFDKNGKAWVGSNLGVILIDSKTYQIVNFKADILDFQNTSDNKVASGHDGQMLLYTNDSIKVYDVNTLHHQDRALPAIVVGETSNVLFDDGQGHYFVATEKGLFRMDYQLDNVQRLGYKQNLNTSMISNNGIVRTSDCLWFCTANGLYRLKHGALDKGLTNQGHFQILPYRLVIGDTPVGIGKERETLNNKRIVTTWNFVQSKISFIPVFVDYAKQDGRIYEFQLDRGEWKVAKEQVVSISELLPGRHRLAIRLLGIPSSETYYSVWVVPSVLFWIEVLLFLLVISAGLYFRAYRKKTKVLLDERNMIEQALIEVEEVQKQEEEKQEIPSTDNKKTVKVNQTEMEKLFYHVDEWMKTEKPYLSPDMRLSDMSAAMGVSNTILSNMFKYYLEKSYYDYVNGYRLNEFKRYLEEKAYKQYTIIALSEKCGFKKSSFFTTFRKMEGMTPTEYLQKHT